MLHIILFLDRLQRFLLECPTIIDLGVRITKPAY